MAPIVRGLNGEKITYSGSWNYRLLRTGDWKNQTVMEGEFRMIGIISNFIPPNERDKYWRGKGNSQIVEEIEGRFGRSKAVYVCKSRLDSDGQRVVFERVE